MRRLLLRRWMQVYSIAAMTATTNDPIRRMLAAALMVFPCLFILVFLMHFGHASDFFHFKLHYVQRPPEQIVAALIRAQNRWPMVHDPHVIGYLGLQMNPL
jgi:hypothetical protein